MKFAIAVIAMFVLAGCASMQPAPTDAIAKLPIIRVGNPPPQNMEYIVFYPAGYTFPAKLKTAGSLFASEKLVETQVALTKDLYLYKYWASHDGKLWKNSHELLRVDFGGGLDLDGLHANVTLDAK
ncbi:MAG: hypothetical protein Q7U91_00185 [Sideroxyarcus sp.]|nr:hypothetical protein [Sideroxyarcus sp.]